MEIEADLVLPRLLTALGVEDCVLVGHSDGGTIALNYAAADPEPLRAVVTLAAHAINEPVCVEAITRARAAFASGDLRQKLAKYHDDVDGAFHLWADAWVAPGFEPMDANRRLPGVVVPVQAIQGEDDEYGSMAQVEAIASGARNSAGVELLKLADCRHSAHKDQTVAVIEAINRFVENLDLAVPSAPTP